jgi:hypothetical protein
MRAYIIVSLLTGARTEEIRALLVIEGDAEAMDRIFPAPPRPES